MNAIVTILRFPGRNDLFNRDILVGPMICDILHELFIFGIEGMKDGILTAIEFQWYNFVPSAELKVKGRGCLAPLAVKIKLRKTVIDK